MKLLTLAMLSAVLGLTAPGAALAQSRLPNTATGQQHVRDVNRDMQLQLQARQQQQLQLQRDNQRIGAPQSCPTGMVGC